MRNVGCLILASLCVGAAPRVSAQEAIYVIRHAERADDSADTELSAAGLKRADTLARVLGDAKITRIFVTNRRRTAQTAAPLAKLLHINPIVIDAADEATLIKSVRSSKPSDRVLIVGHGQTVPTILVTLGVHEQVNVNEEFDNMYVVVPQGSADPVFFHLKY